MMLPESTTYVSYHCYSYYHCYCYYQSGALIQPESDETLLREMDDGEPVGGLGIPTLYNKTFILGRRVG